MGTTELLEKADQMLAAAEAQCAALDDQVLSPAARRLHEAVLARRIAAARGTRAQANLAMNAEGRIATLAARERELTEADSRLAKIERATPEPAPDDASLAARRVREERSMLAGMRALIHYGMTAPPAPNLIDAWAARGLVRPSAGMGLETVRRELRQEREALAGQLRAAETALAAAEPPAETKAS